jgi:hypothetical protein
MAKEKERRNDEAPDDLSAPGEKSSWERTVDRMPSGEDEDPKENEPRRGDFSEREGDFGKDTPGSKR